MPEPIYTGGCLCKAVRYEARGVPLYRAICHCDSCRRATGGAMVPWATFNDARFKVTQGEMAEFASSAEVLRGFCARCGSALTYRHEGRTGEVDITVCTLDGPAALAPAMHVFVQEKLPYVQLADGLPQFDTLPDGN